MARKSLSYSYRFYDKRGRRVARSRLRAAASFEVFYGSRLILDAAFSSRTKLVSQKTNAIERVTRNIENQRLEALEKRRIKRAKVRKKVIRKEVRKKKVKAKKEQLVRRKRSEKKKREREKKVVKRRTRKSEKEFVAKSIIEKRNLIETRFSRSDKLDYSAIYYEPPETLTYATVSDVKLIPYKTKSKEYTKRLVEKTITRGEEFEDDLKILDFNLKPNYFIEFSKDTYEESVRYAYSFFFPHLEKFWDEYGKENPRTILRFDYIDENGIKMGLSFHRILIETREQLKKLFINTFNKFQGIVDPEVGGRRMTNYISGDKIIWITGFDFELSQRKSVN